MFPVKEKYFKILVFWKRLLCFGKLCCVLKRLLIVKNVLCYSELLARNINWIKTFLDSAIRNIKNWCMLLLVQLGACSSYIKLSENLQSNLLRYLTIIIIIQKPKAPSLRIYHFIIKLATLFQFYFICKFHKILV